MDPLWVRRKHNSQTVLATVWMEAVGCERDKGCAAIKFLTGWCWDICTLSWYTHIKHTQHDFFFSPFRFHQHRCLDSSPRVFMHTMNGPEHNFIDVAACFWIHFFKPRVWKWNITSLFTRWLWSTFVQIKQLGRIISLTYYTAWWCDHSIAGNININKNIYLSKLTPTMKEWIKRDCMRAATLPELFLTNTSKHCNSNTIKIKRAIF